MSVSVISLSRNTSTVRIMRRELNRIEQTTGVRPEDWLQEVHDDAVNEYRNGDDFDFESFDLHMSCVADNFIDFWKEHYQFLNNTI